MATHPRKRAATGRSGRWFGIVRRFQSENMFQTSAALAFTTLMALVPLVTVVLALAESLPFLDVLLSRLDFLFREALLPTGASGTILGGIDRFTRRAQNLTALGIAFLGVTAFLLIHTIERTFNHLWQVKPRAVLARLRLYAFLMLVWPFVLGAVVGVMSYVVTTSLGWFDESLWLHKVVLKTLALLLLGLFFSFLYFAVPNATVSRRAAALGGVFAMLGFALMQKVFEAFLVSSATLKSIYGAFAAFPVFLVWLHFSWAVVMLGGLVAATANRPAKG